MLRRLQILIHCILLICPLAMIIVAVIYERREPSFGGRPIPAQVIDALFVVYAITAIPSGIAAPWIWRDYYGAFWLALLILSPIVFVIYFGACIATTGISF